MSSHALASADAGLAGVSVAALGSGVVLVLAGAATGSIPLAVGGGALAGIALVLLMAPRWIDPLLLVTLAAPLPAVWSSGSVRVAAVAPVTAAACAAWVLYRAGSRHGLHAGTLPTRTLGLLGLVFVLATAAAPAPLLVARELLNLAVLAGLLFLATDLFSETPSLRERVGTLLAVLGVACGALAALETLGVIPGAFPRWGTPFNRAALGFGQPNGLGLFLALVLPLIAWRAAEAPRATVWLWRAGLGVAAVGLLATFSRGAWGSTIAGAAALAAAGAWRRSARIVGGTLLGALVLDVVSGGMVRDTIARTVGDWVVEQRAALVLAGVLMFLDRPWLGFGPGGFEAELDHYGIQIPDLWDFQPTPHNAYVQMAAETGVVGLILYVGLMVAMVRRAAAATRGGEARADAPLARALLWSLGILIVSGFFIWPFAHGTGQVVILFFALVASAPSAAPHPVAVTAPRFATGAKPAVAPVA